MPVYHAGAILKQKQQQLGLHVAPGVASISSQMMPSSSGDGFVATKTLSGRSLGSLCHYSTEWNAADTPEVTLALHPAAPGRVAQTMLEVKLAVEKADKTSRVT
jgi:hypothetical protein